MCRTKVNSPGEKRNNFFSEGKTAEPSLSPTPHSGGGGGEAGGAAERAGAAYGTTAAAQPLRRFGFGEKGQMPPADEWRCGSFFRQADPRAALTTVAEEARRLLDSGRPVLMRGAARRPMLALLGYRENDFYGVSTFLAGLSRCGAVLRSD